MNSLHKSAVFASASSGEPEKWIARLRHLAVASLMVGTSTISQSQQPDVTGIHTQKFACSIEHKRFGRAHLERCFQGYATASFLTRYVLIQNGEHVCGHSTSCIGFNCSQIFDGETVGEWNGDRLTLYSATGHIESGSPEIEEFVVSRAGELLVPGTKQLVFTKIAKVLHDQNKKNECLPVFKQPIQIKHYELDIQGNRPKKFSFSDKLEKPVFRPPQTKTVVLTSKSEDLELNDLPRVPGNMVPRNVLVINQSSLTWRVAGDSYEFPACAEFLRNEERRSNGKRGAFANAYGDPLDVKPNSRLSTKVCVGDTLDITRTLPACPRFFCLKGCKC
jgi:hypothetical protein